MEKDDPHTPVYMIDDPLGNTILKFLVMTVGPPDKDIGVVKDLFGETLLRIAKYRSTDSNGRIFVEKTGDTLMDSPGIYIGNSRFPVSLGIFVPDIYPYLSIHFDAFLLKNFRGL
jgi:hypothetical protein